MILNKIKNIFYKTLYYFRIQYGLLLFNKRVILIGTPWHGNIGDQALVYAEKYLLKIGFNGYKIVEIPSNIYNSKFFYNVKHNIKKNDIIFLQGGGNLGTLYLNEEQFHRNIMQSFPENRVVIMPMSIFFHDNDFGHIELEKSMEIYNHHRNLTIISRDENSFSFSRKYFYNAKNVLAPDSVTSLDGIIDDEAFSRNGVCFFLRKDVEKIVSDDIINSIISYLSKDNIEYNLSDTADDNSYRSDTARKKIIFSRLYMAKKSRLVITDRYHGVIFAVITHTPVIVFKSFDTKISSGVKWFKDLDWVHYLNPKDTNRIIYLIDKYCKGEEYNIKIYSSCKDIIVNKIKSLAMEKSDR